MHLMLSFTLKVNLWGVLHNPLRIQELFADQHPPMKYVEKSHDQYDNI